MPSFPKLVIVVQRLTICQPEFDLPFTVSPTWYLNSLTQVEGTSLQSRGQVMGLLLPAQSGQAAPCRCVPGSGPQARMGMNGPHIQKDPHRNQSRGPFSLENYLTISSCVKNTLKIQCNYHFQSILQFLTSFHIHYHFLIYFEAYLERDARAQAQEVIKLHVCAHQHDVATGCERISSCWGQHFPQWPSPSPSDQHCLQRQVMEKLAQDFLPKEGGAMWPSTDGRRASSVL